MAIGETAMKYYVYTSEVWIRTREVEADNPQEVLQKLDAEDYVDIGNEFSHENGGTLAIEEA